jgi:biotin carboxyl carrier protein
MKYRFQIDKKNVEIEVANNATFHSPTDITVDKTRLELTIGELNDTEPLSFFVGSKLYKVEVVRDNDGYPTGVFVNDEYYPASLLKIDSLFYYREKEVKSAKSGIMKSFIPGYIKKIYYAVGDKVEEDDIILIHEAMKMENEIRAPRAGVLKALGVKEGENILANHQLFEIE